MKDASYKLNLLIIIQIFRSTGQSTSTVLCKQKLINPHSVGFDRSTDR